MEKSRWQGLERRMHKEGDKGLCVGSHWGVRRACQPQNDPRSPHQMQFRKRAFKTAREGTTTPSQGVTTTIGLVSQCTRTADNRKGDPFDWSSAVLVYNVTRPRSIACGKLVSWSSDDLQETRRISRVALPFGPGMWLDRADNLRGLKWTIETTGPVSKQSQSLATKSWCTSGRKNSDHRARWTMLRSDWEKGECQRRPKLPSQQGLCAGQWLTWGFFNQGRSAIRTAGADELKVCPQLKAIKTAD